MTRSDMRRRLTSTTIIGLILAVRIAGAEPTADSPELPALEPGDDAGAPVSAPRKAWPYRLTPGQHALLSASGVSFDSRDRRIAGEMLRRGFSDMQYMQACRDWSNAGNRDKRIIVDLAVLRLLGVTTDYFQHYAESGKTLTAYYNEQFIGGKGKRVGGALVMVAGAAGIAGGAVLIHHFKEPSSSGMIKNAHMIPLALGIIVAAAGVAAGAAGGVMINNGHHRVNSWLPAGTLERAPVNELRNYTVDNLDSLLPRESDEPPRGPAASLAVAPVITSDGGGFGLTVSF